MTDMRRIGAGKGSVRHVEVFRVDGVGTSIIGRPRPLPTHRRANPNYTLDCEELRILHTPYRRPFHTFAQTIATVIALQLHKQTFE